MTYIAKGTAGFSVFILACMHRMWPNAGREFYMTRKYFKVNWIALINKVILNETGDRKNSHSYAIGQ